MADLHPFDEAVSEILDWLTDEPAYYAEALRGGHAAPFGADVTEAQKLEYYQRQVFATHPDGSINYDQPNPQGRDMLIKRVGIPGYTQIMAAVMPKRSAGLAASTALDSSAAESGEQGGSY
jgi:hypothetical protein